MLARHKPKADTPLMSLNRLMTSYVGPITCFDLLGLSTPPEITLTCPEGLPAGVQHHECLLTYGTSAGETSDGLAFHRTS